MAAYAVRWREANVKDEKWKRFDTLKEARKFARESVECNDSWAEVYEQRLGMYSRRNVREYKV